MNRSSPVLSGRAGALVSRYGRRTLIALAVIAVAGLILRCLFVAFPDRDPGDDSLAYRALAAALYEDGTYGAGDFRNSSDWSPGAPLIYAGAWYLTGGVRDGVARGVEALLGTATIVIAFLLTARLVGPGRRDDPEGYGRSAADRGPPDFVDHPADPLRIPAAGAPLLAAALVAFYPPFVTAPGSLMSEPPAEFTLPAAILAFLWADRRGGNVAWIWPGLLFGITALIRPEYLAIAACFALFLLIRAGLRGTRGRAVLATLVFGLAVLAPIVPWTVHNYLTLDRVVPISTGSGKALFTGTYRPGDGEYQQVKAALLEQQTGRHLAPDSAALDRVDPVPLFDRVAGRYPSLDRDAALGRIGRENLERFVRDDPLGYLGMTSRKIWRMWSTSSGGPLGAGPGAAIQILLVVLGLAGLLLLAWRRRWEAIPLAIPLVGITALAAITLAPPRRNEILMTLILPLASIAFMAACGRLRRRDPKSASPPLVHPEESVL